MTKTKSFIHAHLFTIISMFIFIGNVKGCLKSGEDKDVDECKTGAADVCFVLDSSGSIRGQNPYDGSFDNWQDGILGYVEDILWRLDIGPDKARVGIIKYSSSAVTEFHLNEISSKVDLIERVRTLSYIGSGTNTAGAIKEMTENFFSTENGDRRDVDNIGIIITDGHPNDPAAAIEAATDAIASGIKMFSIGITDNIDEYTLSSLSSPPQELNKNYWINPNFEELASTVDGVSSEACGVVPPPDPGCGSSVLEISDSVGVIHSPGFLSTYPHHTQCRYLIVGWPEHVIQLQYTMMAIEETDCADNVAIYDGASASADKLSMHCQLKTPSEVIVTSGRSAFVVFQSDSQYTSLGFELVFESRMTCVCANRTDINIRNKPGTGSDSIVIGTTKTVTCFESMNKIESKDGYNWNKLWYNWRGAWISDKYLQPGSAAECAHVSTPCLSTTSVNHKEAEAMLTAAGITISSSGYCDDRTIETCTSLDCIRPQFINGIIRLKNESVCTIVVTGGTEVGHAGGEYSHGNGYKIDIRLNTCIDNYIKAFTFNGTRSDGAALYRDDQGVLYAKESNHWDILYP